MAEGARRPHHKEPHHASYVKSLESTNGEFATGGLSSEWAFSAFAAANVAAADLLPPHGSHPTGKTPIDYLVTQQLPLTGGGFCYTTGTTPDAYSINGVSNTATTTWRVSIDNGTSATASNTKVVTLGDTIGLKYGS